MPLALGEVVEVVEDVVDEDVVELLVVLEFVDGFVVDVVVGFSVVEVVPVL